MTQLPLKERAEALQSWALSEKDRMKDLPKIEQRNLTKSISPDQIEVVYWYIDNDMLPAITLNNTKTKIWICLFPPTFEKDLNII